MTEICKSCGAPIVWKMTDKGKPMPLDPKPKTVCFQNDDGTITVKLAYISHFATCIWADQHRKQKQKD